MGKIYVVATPIGNLSDITIRAITILKSVDYVFCEDTRVTKRLLKYIKSDAKTVSYHQHTTPAKSAKLLEIAKTREVALVSDAGTPVISDPGASLLNAARECEIEIVAVPGASALVAACSISGFSSDRFLFLGFLPQTKGKRTKAIEKALEFTSPVIIYETPHKLISTLEIIEKTKTKRRLFIAREISKKFEESFVGDAVKAIELFKNPKGEFVIILE